MATFVQRHETKVPACMPQRLRDQIHRESTYNKYIKTAGGCPETLLCETRVRFQAMENYHGGVIVPASRARDIFLEYTEFRDLDFGISNGIPVVISYDDIVITDHLRNLEIDLFVSVSPNNIPLITGEARALEGLCPCTPEGIPSSVVEEAYKQMLLDVQTTAQSLASQMPYFEGFWFSNFKDIIKAAVLRIKVATPDPWPERRGTGYRHVHQDQIASSVKFFGFVSDLCRR